MLIVGFRPVVAKMGIAMTDRMCGDLDDADEIIARSVADLHVAGVSDSAIAGALLVRSILLWRKEGYTDDEICCEFATCIRLPFGRNAPRGSKRARKSPT
jgi:hypothetical protein